MTVFATGLCVAGAETPDRFRHFKSWLTLRQLSCNCFVI